MAAPVPGPAAENLKNSCKYISHSQNIKINASAKTDNQPCTYQGKNTKNIWRRMLYVAETLNEINFHKLEF